MKKFGLIGHPIAHSLSPALFKAGYDGRYTYDLIEEESFEAAYSRFINEYDGINVTAPFKEQAFAKADILSEECRAIGAANILIKTPQGIEAHNSDYLGVRMWIQEVSGNDTSKSVLVVGAGGAGTFSDGKLYTRSNKRGNIQGILQIFHHFGADSQILIDAHPHIGTDKLPSVIQAMTQKIVECGGEVHFGCRCTELLLEKTGKNPRVGVFCVSLVPENLIYHPVNCGFRALRGP